MFCPTLSVVKLKNLRKTPNAVNTREKGKEGGTKGGTVEGGREEGEKGGNPSNNNKTGHYNFQLGIERLQACTR